jgi:putative transposase
MQDADLSPVFLRKRLRRLDRSFYRGHCYVHWTISMQHRATGWLDDSHHLAVRQLLQHALSRHFLCCPVYCLMPDHGHFLFVGLEARADQLTALTWFRRGWNRLLQPVQQQDQAYDSVLREADRNRDAFANVLGYVLRNPVRRGLVAAWQDWPYSGALFPGYPTLDPRKPMFWVNFWKAYAAQGRL